MNNRSLTLPIFVAVALLFMLIYALFRSEDTILLLEGVLVFIFVYKLTWRRDEPPIIFFALISQFIQVVSILFSGVLNQSKISAVTEYPFHIYTAFHYSLYSIAFLALGYFLATSNFKFEYRLPQFLEDIKEYNNLKLLGIYVALILFLPTLQSLATATGAFRQPIYKLLEIKWAMLFILFSSAFLLRINVWLFGTVLLFEILMSFTGYFSNFKEIILMVVISYLTYFYRLSLKQYFWITVVGFIMVATSIIWQYTKTDYRNFLSNESSEQRSDVGRVDAISKFKDLIVDFEDSNIDAATQQLLDRVSYINFFSAAISHVPAQVKHENGRLYADALTRSFTPRFLFPNKSMIDDSEITTKYTVIKVLGIESGTSISIGYITETYIDFGYPLMFLAIFLLGVFIGIVYRFLMSIAINKVWAYAYLLPFTLSVYSFETALAKFIPAIFFYVIIVYLFNRYMVVRINQYLTSK